MLNIRKDYFFINLKNKYPAMLTLSFEIENKDLPKISELLNQNGIDKFEVEESAEIISRKQYEDLLEIRLAAHEADPEAGYTLKEASGKLKSKYGF